MIGKAQVGFAFRDDSRDVWDGYLPDWDLLFPELVLHGDDFTGFRMIRGKR